MSPKSIFPQKPQAIFFDFDGVILESSDIKTVAFVELFNHLSDEDQKSIKNYHLQNAGISRFKKFQWIYKELLNKDISKEESENLGQEFTKLVFQKILDCPFVPGVVQLLNWSKDNCRNFVASGTPQEELIKIVKERELNEYFDGVFGSPATKANIVEEQLLKYNLERDKCWFIGDASSDYEAALATGLNFVARNTEEFNDFWKAKKDILIVEDLSEISRVWT